MSVKQCSPTVCEIEALARERRKLSNILLNLDAYERWGGGSDQTMNAELEKASQYNSKTEQAKQKIIMLVDNLTQEDREAWADAHIALLANYIENCENSDRDTKTEIYVAREETTEWKKVRKGTVNYVQQNIFYISYDNELYKAYFGMNY